ncbi:hypothetical protein ACJMK2_023832 [Sinanodonta woodiana]|uniref:Uncharacterized protein n=1 Tax=Sinanodonta woodiana TaxID=1069815 RepID=A0ABD3T6T2_SINWO
MHIYKDADIGFQITILEFRSLYPILYFAVSKHSERAIGSNSDIEVTCSKTRGTYLFANYTD